MWATAPYFHNNALGKFTNDPSVAGRMAAFDDAVHKLLWPERREQRTCQEEWGLPFCPPVYRTTKETYLKVPHQYVPDILKITDLTGMYNALQFACDRGAAGWGHYIVENACIRARLKADHPDLAKSGLTNFSASVKAVRDGERGIEQCLDPPEQRQWHVRYGRQLRRHFHMAAWNRSSRLG